MVCEYIIHFQYSKLPQKWAWKTGPFSICGIIKVRAIIFIHQIRTCLFQGIGSPMRFHDASVFQGESATDFNFDDNFIKELMRMIAKISVFLL